ncbi:hypothetical protein BT69DRAFT_1211484, partial [Atractiella rhizophila]
ATSVDVERAFSSGRLTVSWMRHKLSDSSFRASMMMKLWEQDELMPSVKVLLRALKKNDRSQKDAAAARKKHKVQEAVGAVIETIE